MKLENLHDLFIEELKDLYDAEHQITEALPKMIDVTSSSELKKAFETHLRETEEHIRKLEQVFQSIDVKPARKSCKAMQGIIKEAEDLLKENAASAVMDAALIGAAQRVEHYEIAGYGTARAYARQHKHKEAEKILDQILDQESNTDEKLTQIAMQVNEEALKT
jgi:ferritin-like metal-binding protein YciE